MKLSKIEKTVLLLFLVVVIVALGVVLLIMPEYNKIGPNNEALDAAKLERDTMYASLTRESTIDAEIEEAKKQALAVNDYFYDEFKDYDLDIFSRNVLKETGMTAKALGIEPFTTTDLLLKDFSEIPVSYPIKESAEIINGAIGIADGTIQAPEGDYFSQIKDYVQTVGVTNVTFKLTGKKSNYIKFLDYIKDLPQATYLKSVSIPYSKEDESVTDAEGNTISIDGGELSYNDEVEVEITVSFYSVEKLK